MIAFSIGSNVAEAQRQLLTPIATEELPDDFNFEEVYRLDTMFNALSSKVIQVYSPHLLTVGASVIYGNGDALYGSDTLRPISVEAYSGSDYRWRSVNEVGSLDVTILGKDYGFAGSIFDYGTNKEYRIFPIDTSYSVVLEMPDITVACNVGQEDDDPEPIGEPEVDPEECEGDPCPGHIDILIMLTQGARDWLGPFPEAVLDVAMEDLQASLENSEIDNTVAYSYLEVDYEVLDTTSCRGEARTLNMNQDILDLVAAGNADIAVLLVRPNIQYSDRACVSQIGPNPAAPIALVPVQNILFDFSFVHEVGHLMGGEHDTRPRKVGPDCAKPYTGSDFQTLLDVSTTTEKVLYFSNPNVNFSDEPAGAPENNNAGHMNKVGCLVEEFNPSGLITTQINVDIEDCTLELDAIVSTEASTFTYQWYWNKTGFFNNPSSSSSIGTSASISTVAPPLTDPCSSFFIHVKVLSNGVVISQRTIRLNGGLCYPYYPCNSYSFAPLMFSTLAKIERVFVSDMLGRVIFEKKPSISLINLNDYLQEGVYVLSTVFNDGNTKSSLLYISN